MIKFLLLRHTTQHAAIKCRRSNEEKRLTVVLSLLYSRDANTLVSLRQPPSLQQPPPFQQPIQVLTVEINLINHQHKQNKVAASSYSAYDHRNVSCL